MILCGTVWLISIYITKNLHIHIFPSSSILIICRTVAEKSTRLFNPSNKKEKKEEHKKRDISVPENSPRRMNKIKYWNSEDSVSEKFSRKV